MTIFICLFLFLPSDCNKVVNNNCGEENRYKIRLRRMIVKKIEIHYAGNERTIDKNTEYVTLRGILIRKTSNYVFYLVCEICEKNLYVISVDSGA